LDGKPTASDREANPYLPPAEASQVVLPGAAGIELDGQPIPFSGTVSRDDVLRGFRRGNGSIVLTVLGMIIAAQTLAIAQLRGMVWDDVYALMAIAFVGIMAAAYRTSAHNRTNRYLRSHPTTLTQLRGRIAADWIEVESEYGGGRFAWEFVAGMRVTAQQITLALNPQHAAMLFLPQRFFAVGDWPRIVAATEKLAPMLAFRPGLGATLFGKRLAEGEIPPWGSPPNDAILIDGELQMRDLMYSRYGGKIVMNWLVVIAIAIATVTVLIALWGGFASFDRLLFIMYLGPLILLVRFAMVVTSVVGSPNKTLLRLRLAIDQQGIQMITVRGHSRIHWSALADATIGRRVIFLRETRRTPNFIPLPRRALVDAEQWDRLATLVRSKISEHPSGAETHG
jgi:hypothetical protein